MPERPSIPKDDKHIPHLRGTSINPSKVEGSDAARDVAREPQAKKSLMSQSVSGSEAVGKDGVAEGDTNQNELPGTVNLNQTEHQASWENLKQRLLDYLNQRSEDKALEKLLETLEVESRAGGFCFVCSNKAEHTLLLEKLPKLQELLSRLLPASEFKLTATVKDVPTSLTKPKPAKPSEIREAMAEKNPALLKFIEQLNLKLD